ncbi:hypothetical protein [Clostridium formicaceticum]|uniref:Uncharacterized protein n=1 Tax=Clostridium formicaceticum TaxID=1497 RepID=A0AAC9WJ87_9CLOT|nr:hypothetical protein [Clostridium formicaceticum]AOY74853.1 hypothetical protein BJL90_02095 [Clostridium formicaceticum]ARE89250.1 hypothetical protein CLFO_36570 [Clostridium formicaceticum]
MDKLAIILVSIGAALATYYISIHMNKGAVFGSAIVTLVSGFIFPHFFPEQGATLAVMATCASYAGMVAVTKFPKISEMVAVGFIAGIVFIATTTAYAGVGGKLGTIAAISCLTWLGIKKLYAMTSAQEKERAAE